MRKAWVVIFSLHACAHPPDGGAMRDLSCRDMPEAGFPTNLRPYSAPGEAHGLRLFEDSLEWHGDLFDRQMIDRLVMP